MAGAWLLLAACWAVLGALALAGWVTEVTTRGKRNGAHVMTWRWLSGGEMDGKRRTNATFARKSTRVLHITGHAVFWHHWPRRRRAAIRGGTTVGAPALFLAVLTAPAIIASAFALLLLLAAAVLGWLIWRRLSQFSHHPVHKRPLQLARHHARYVRPLRVAVAPTLGAPPTRLEVAPDYSRVVLGLPAAFTGAGKDRDEVARAVTSKLPIENPDAQWDLQGRKPQVTFLRSQPPPNRVLFAEILEEVRKAKATEVIQGVGRKSALIKASIDGDSPHWGISMGSGDGKSTMARLHAAQMLWHGALLVVLDYKLISHMWARGLPNVAYAGTPQEIHDMCEWLAEEAQRRNNVALHTADIRGNVTGDVGPRIFIIAEELNATQNRIAALWRAIRAKGDPKRSPASEALDEINFIGRQVAMNQEQIGQRLSVKATSGAGAGADARENLGVLFFHDPSESTWKMLVGDDHPRPPASGHLGRHLLVTRSAVREFQVAYITEEEARAFATAGTVAVPRHDMPCVGGMSPIAATVPAVADIAGELTQGPDLQEVSLSHGHPSLSPGGAATLGELVHAGVIPRTLTAAQKNSTRDPDHPQPVGRRGNAHLYDIGEMRAYELLKSRVRAR
jgi:hypothetical protein